MPNNNQLNKEKIDHKLAELTFHVSDDVWNDFLEYHKTNKKKNSGFTFKFEAKFLLFPLGLFVVSSIIYLSVTNIKSQNITTNSFIDKKDEVVEQKLIEEVIKSPEKPKPLAKKTIVIDTLTSSTTDSTLSTDDKADSVVESVIVNENAVKENEKKNKEDRAEIKKPEDDSVNQRRTNEETKKTKPKKKKRKNPAVSSETFKHHPEEDEIVVPN